MLKPTSMEKLNEDLELEEDGHLSRPSQQRLVQALASYSDFLGSEILDFCAKIYPMCKCHCACSRALIDSHRPKKLIGVKGFTRGRCWNNLQIWWIDASPLFDLQSKLSVNNLCGFNKCGENMRQSLTYKLV